MRSVLGLAAGCAILMLVACSRTDPPESGEPVAVIPSAVEVDIPLPVEETPDEAAGSESAMEGKTGLAVGRKAPSFRIKDQTGTDRSLDDLLTEGKVALVFYRSADW